MIAVPSVDPARLHNKTRVAAAAWATQVMPTLAVRLDAVAALAARLLNAPIGAVSVVSADYDDCIGAHGLPAPLTRQVPLRYSVCKYVVSADHPVAVADMRQDPELRDHPSLYEFGVLAFAGVPLRDANDQPFGALTVVDVEPRAWTPQQLTTLVEVAALLGPIPARPPNGPLSLLDDPSTSPTDVAVQAQIQIQHRFITALLDSLQVGVLAADSEGTPVLCNRALREIYGIGTELSAREALTITQRALRHPDGRRKAPQETALQRALSGESVRDVEALLRQPGTPERALLTNGEPIRAPDGRLLGAVSTVMDVTASRRAERFRAAELDIATLLNKARTLDEVAPQVVHRIGTLLGSSYIGLWLVDPATDALYQDAHWNAPGVMVTDLLPLRITRGQAGPGRVWSTGQPLYIPNLATSPYHHDRLGHRFAQACLARGLHAAALLPLRESDRVLGVLSCLCGTASEETPHLTELLSGIAAQISAFLTRRYAADLSQQLSRAKDDFIALVGHAVRTPLTSISTMAELLHESTDLPADTRHMVDVVARNARTLRTIVAQLLDLAALETGEDALQPDDTDLSDIIRAAVHAAQPAAQASGVRVSVRMPVHLRLLADPARIRQLVDNLLGNAITYSPAGQVRVQARRRGTTVELRVSDNGIGIPADQRDRVFDRFFRADNVAHSTTTGTGLGLTLVHAIAHAHGGTVHLADQPNPGTTIIVRLPGGVLD